ncbi:hypothetical protein EVC20_118 [Rhizobium phage RHph_Y2_17_1]|nr:hypothetical protein EVC19_118 [Rhizobium phage RHph_Y2_11]QIG75857.1 hypothetical protein EVC20_118 [Rhizobium phage RHph_Y2_17_1]
MAETMSFEITLHADDEIARHVGPGWYHSFDNAGDKGIVPGPYKTREAAEAAALKVIEIAAAEAVAEALFGEQA